jgi:hypothetical protein
MFARRTALSSGSGAWLNRVQMMMTQSYGTYEDQNIAASNRPAQMFGTRTDVRLQ